MQRRFSLLSLAFLATLLAGCASTPAPGPFASPTAAPMGENPVRHAEGVCALCDLYYVAKQSVVLVSLESSLGTGVIVGDRGLVVTNAHVVGEADTVSIELNDGSTTAAQVIARDTRIDLALLQIAPAERPWIALMLEGDDRPPVGTDIYIIGHPLGLGWSVSRGVVSGHRRSGEIGPIDLIQTDAAISPGNSGGPMVTADSRIVGIVVSKLASNGAENIAFAIPVSEVRAFIQRSQPAE